MDHYKTHWKDNFFLSQKFNLGLILMKGKALPGNKTLNTFLTLQSTIFTLLVHLIESTKIFQEPKFNCFFNKNVFFHKH